MSKTQDNWKNSLIHQIDFYYKSCRKKRFDDDFDWRWLESQKNWTERVKDRLRPSFIKSAYDFIFRRPTMPFTKKWFVKESDLLWKSRQMLNDEMSRMTFDNHLLLSICGPEKYYLPRINYDDLVSIRSREPFSGNLPTSYLNLPLKKFDITLKTKHGIAEMSIISAELLIKLLNKYHQYFLRRGDMDFSPKTGEVVLDCGSCIGDISMIFAGLVGNTGEVHLFDPVPLHNRFSKLQAELNPSLSRSIHINTFAVGCESTRKTNIEKTDTAVISPGGCAVKGFDSVTIDDYVADKGIRRVDYIKMDIEGSEADALRGASKIIKEFKPRLAISAYHKVDDLWKIPDLIRELNPEYKIYFDQHFPKIGESVYYAI